MIHEDPVCAEPKLFVGGLRFEVPREEVFQHFTQYGPIKNCVLLTHQDTGKSKGCAMVLFSKWTHAEAAVTAENGAASHLSGPRPLICKFADPQRRPEDGVVVGVTPKKLFIGQVAAGVTTETIRDIFAPYGEIVDLNVMPPKKDGAMGCAFVTFATWAAAEAAIDGVDGKFTLPGGANPVAVKLADAKPQDIQRVGGKRGLGDAMAGAGPLAKRQFMGAGGMGAAGGMAGMGWNGMGMGMNPMMMGGMMGLGQGMMGQMQGMPGMMGMMGPMGAGMGGAMATGQGVGAQQQGPGMGGSAQAGMGGAQQLGGAGQLGDGSAGPAMPPGSGAGADASGLGGLGGVPGQDYGQGSAQGGMMQQQPGQQQLQQAAAAQMMGGYGLQGGMMGGMMGGPMGMPGMAGMMGMPGMGAMGAGMGMGGMMGGMMGGAAMGGMGGGGAMGVGNAGGALTAAKAWKLFLGQVSYDLNEADLYPFFQQFGTVLELVLLRNTDGRSRGCGFLTYSSQAEAEAAIASANGVVLPNDTRARPLSVKYANHRG